VAAVTGDVCASSVTKRSPEAARHFPPLFLQFPFFFPSFPFLFPLFFFFFTSPEENSDKAPFKARGRAMAASG